MNLLELAFPDDARRAPHAPSCVDCARPIPASDFFCGECYRARQGTGRRVVSLDDARRVRTAARLAGRPCPVHGPVDWHVTPRGDAWCPACHPPAGGVRP